MCKVAGPFLGILGALSFSGRLANGVPNLIALMTAKLRRILRMLKTTTGEWHKCWLIRRAPFCITIASATLLFSLAVTSCKNSAVPRSPSAAPPIPTVTVARVVQKDVPIYDEAVGTTTGFVNAQIHPKVSGYLIKQDHKDGSRVHPGQLLFEIDPRQYQAALNETLGNFDRSQAQFKQNQQTLDRYTELYKEAVISKQTFDDITQTTRASKAQVEAYAATVQNAKLNLQWTKVYSPIDGVAGIAQAQIGDLVGTSTLLTTVSQLDPIKVSFPISEKEYLDFARPINADENGNPTNSPRLDLILDNGSIYSYPGQIYAVNRQVDVQTGTIMLQATFPNPENVLRPGMYAKLRAQTGIRHNALLVPQSSVVFIQGQYEVAVVGSDNMVTLRGISPGKKVDNLWVIDDGLKPGETVVTEGAQKISVGAEVKPVLAAEQPNSDASPSGAKGISKE
jgi:RND family efflux transporter MFP subunit